MENSNLFDTRSKTINAWWSRSPVPGNFGDILTPWLIKKICGYRTIFKQPPFPAQTLLGIGSTIKFANENTVVWGSGAMSADNIINRQAEYLCVRGPKTQELLEKRNIQPPTIIGDPALLMPTYYYPKKVKQYKIGIFAHYVDTKQVTAWYRNDRRVKVINPLAANPATVVDQLLECERIISSSLHGIIIAHAYNIPVAWAKHSDKLCGDDTKFHDHFGCLDIKAEANRFFQRKSFEDMELMEFTENSGFDAMPIAKVLKDKVNHE